MTSMVYRAIWDQSSHVQNLMWSSAIWDQSIHIQNLMMSMVYCDEGARASMSQT